MNKRFKDAEKFSKGSAIRHKEQQHEMGAAMSTERCPTCGWIPAITDPPKCERCGHTEPCPACGSDERDKRLVLPHPTEDARCFDPWHTPPPASTPDAAPAIPFQFLLKRFRAAAFPSSACPEKFLEIHKEHFDDFCTGTELAVSELLEASNKLAKKLDKIGDATAGIFTMAMIQGVTYRGPTWKEELDTVKALLAKWRKEV